MKKPTAKVIGRDGNIFVVLGTCMRALKDSGQKEESKEMAKRVFSSGSYEEALSIMMEYCEFE